MKNQDYGEELHRIASSLPEEEQQELLKEYQHVFQKYNGTLSIDYIQFQFLKSYKAEKREKKNFGLSLFKRTRIISDAHLNLKKRIEVDNDKSI